VVSFPLAFLPITLTLSSSFHSCHMSCPPHPRLYNSNKEGIIIIIVITIITVITFSIFLPVWSRHLLAISGIWVCCRLTDMSGDCKEGEIPWGGILRDTAPKRQEIFIIYSSTSGGRSVGVVRSRTKGHGVFFLFFQGSQCRLVLLLEAKIG
jgi:hypothetical protein